MKIKITESQHKMLIVENQSLRTVDEIFDFIKNLPNKHSLKSSREISLELMDNTLDTVLHNSKITHFYLRYLRHKKKSSKIMYYPDSLKGNLHSYDKLIHGMKLCKQFEKEEDDENNKRFMRMMSSMCFQFINALLYEDYFDIKPNISFRSIASDIDFPSKKDIFKEYMEKNFNSRECLIRTQLFFFDTLSPIIRIIEK